MQSWVVVGAAILLLLVLVREIITNRESRRLVRSLRDAYRVLEEKNDQVLDHTAQLEQLNDELQAVQSELIRNNRELVESRSLWERLAITDNMTGIANHRAFQARLREEIARAQRYDYPFVLLMCDVDNFKPYNDTYGHPAGDEVLKEVAAVMRETVREGDLVARYGGEEFAAILPQTDSAHARIVAGRIREAVRRHGFAHRDVTLSIGAAEYSIDGSDAETLIFRADQALFAAKRAGRDRVVFVQDVASRI